MQYQAQSLQRNQHSSWDTPITWKDEETKEVNKMDTTFYVANTPGPAILGLPSCSSLRIVNLNCSVSTQEAWSTC